MACCSTMPETKTVLLGTTKILQWNASGLSPQKFTELKLILNKKKVNAFIINEANITEANFKFYQIRGWTVQALYKKRQVASGILIGVKSNLKSKFIVLKEMNNVDTSEIIEAIVWINNKKLKIYGLYSPPPQK
jgi:hypothetical protein